MFELAKEHGVAEMEIRRGRIKTGFYAQRLAGGERFLQLGPKLGLLNDFSGAFLDVGQLFVNGREGGHEQTLLQKTRFIDENATDPGGPEVLESMGQDGAFKL
jgi:hypothetical protein